MTLHLIFNLLKIKKKYLAFQKGLFCLAFWALSLPDLDSFALRFGSFRKTVWCLLKIIYIFQGIPSTTNLYKKSAVQHAENSENICKFAAMKRIIMLLFAVAMLVSCDRKQADDDVFTVDVLNKMTPVKDQGASDLCWAYAMLATIESEHIMQGDSVNLSVDYLARRILLRQAERYYLSQGCDTISLRGVAPMSLDALAEYGAMPYEAYHSECNYNVVGRKLTALCNDFTSKRKGIKSLHENAESMLDDLINPVPKNVYMFSVEYTPVEFAHSVCLPNEYVALTSFTHKPFYERIVLDLPDNKTACKFLNLPLDSMLNRVVNALQSGHCVCWEGDISEPGFNFERGVAKLENTENAVSQEARQRAFEDFSTTDDHCMEIVGLAHDASGSRYFICKNSWGSRNPYGGLVYMSADYFKMKTVAVVLPSVVM